MTLEKDFELESYLSSVYVISHSYSSVSSYRLSVINRSNTGFRNFLDQKYGIDEHQLVLKTKSQDLDVYKILKEFVVFLDSNEYKPKSIQLRVTAVKGYLRHLGIKIHSDECKQIVRMPKRIRHREEPLTKEIILRLLRNVSPKLQTVILVLSASGMRIGELAQLKISDIDFESRPVAIRIRAEITKTREARESFLTTEAANSLKDYLKRFFEWKEGGENPHLRDVAIFGRTSLAKDKKQHSAKYPQHLAVCGLLMRTLTYYLQRLPELDIKNGDGRHQIHFHAFRKFFRTTVGNVSGRDYAEALIGHGFYMDTYYVLSEEQKREMYLKAEPYLTISDFKAVEKTMTGLSEKYIDLEGQLIQLKQYLRLNSIPVPVNLDMNANNRF